MVRKSRFKSDISESIHTSAAMLHEVGVLDRSAMREFDECHLLMPIDLEPAQIKLLREVNNVSRSVFAGYLNTSERTVEKWEAGVTRPNAIALKLLTVVQKHGLKVLA